MRKCTGRTTTRLLLVPACAAATVAVRPSWGADDKNGVSPTTISRPTGPGSLEGLGDAFQPALNTGTAAYTVSLSLPEGVAGFTPGLSLRYDSGRGFGPAGIGWSFGPGGIRRQTDKGLPRYIDPPADSSDRFLGMNDEELVPLANGSYLAKIEGAFIRYRRVDDHWEAHTKNGNKLEFGLTDNDRLTDSTGTKIYKWHLERQTDTNGNVIEYDYIRPSEDDRQIYLSEVRYGPGAPPWDHSYSVAITYEDRPDPRVDYRPGFRVRTAKRIARIDVKYDDTLIRRYALGYGTHPHWSLLTTLTQYGDDGASTLPVTTFGYATFEMGPPETPLSAAGRIIGSIGEPGSVPGNAKVEFIDINADGLGDLLVTDAGHLAYLNHGLAEVEPGQPVIRWEGPVAVAAEDVRAFNVELSESNVHLADMTGDGIADLVVTGLDWIEYFPNSGQVGWAAGQLMSVEHSPPPAPFGPDGESVLTSDLDFDKRIDVIKSDYGSYSAWFNLGGGAFSDEVLTNGAWHGQQFIDFASSGVHLADMNGDRLNDVVKVTPISVVYCANMGFGRFDQSIEIMLPDRWLDDAPGGNLHRARLTDVNGDGLADLAVERAEGDNLWFWLNMGDNTFALSRVITGLPATPGAATRWLDINGNGTTDLVYADSSLPDSRINAVDLGELIAGSSHFNALTSIDNGFGRHTAIFYRSTTDYCVDAFDAGRPWTSTVPFPSAIVSQTKTSIGLDLDGYPDEGPDGDVHLTDYVYRDGYYDPLEKQFRGFAFVKQIERGDERFGGSGAPTLVTRHAFHTGAPDGIDNDGNSETDEYHEWDGREEEPFKGVELWRESCSLPDDPTADGEFAEASVVYVRIETQWDIHDLCGSAGGSIVELLDAGYQTDDGYGRRVRQAVATTTRRSVIERQTDPSAHKHLERRSDLDPLGNTLFEWNLGDLSNAGDDLYTGYEYAYGEPGWIVDRVSRTFQREGGPDGAFVSEIRNYYDGLPFQGLPLGEIGDAGRLHRSESLISGGEVPELAQRSFLRGDPRDPAGAVSTQRQQFDPFGNPIVMLDANAALDVDGLPDGNGHERRIEYDSILHKFPVRETVVVGGGEPDLEVIAQHHYGFGTPQLVTDFNGNETRYTYDTFGRLEREILPGDDPIAPTRVYDYNWDAPFSSITTSTHTREGESPDVETTQFFDGLGRALGSFEPGGPVMKGVTQYSTRGQAWKVFQPYFGEPVDAGGSWLLPDGALAATMTRYDATGRAVEIISPPDQHGVSSRARTDYLPLTVVQYDGEDNLVAGPHANTPKIMVSDGLGRLIEVHEIETLAGDPGTFVTRYRYALPELVAEIEDANGNVKYMRYDGLGRRIFMNDCDRGHTTYSYDAVGNLLGAVDAKGQGVAYTYDGVNRLLTEDYLDAGTPLSLERTPDITYHYDRPSPAYPTLPNLRGKFSWVEDLTGAEFHGFDARGNRETVIKRVSQIDGGTRDFTTVNLHDSLGRVYQTVYPDGGVVRYRYDGRGLLEVMPGFVEQFTYLASGQKATCSFANGVTTTYAYDPRQRLTRLATESTGGPLQDLSYEYDQVSNVLGIADARTLAPDDPRNQTADFTIDNTYRLTRAIGAGYGTIEYDYDRLGNMVEKTSPDIVDPVVNLGDMISGGTAGTQNRIGREPGEPPGPHALTSAFDGDRLRGYDYDDNGNMISNDGDEYLYDFKDRIGKIIKDDRDIRYLYDHTGRRVIKRVDGVQTTYIDRLSEVRDDELIKYIFAGRTRVARVEGSIPPPPVVTQRLSLVEGWNLISFQVEPSSTDPATILADIAGKYDVVYGHNGSEYTCHQPAGVDSTLTSLLPNHGYWIRVNQAAELLIEGTISETPVPVSALNPALVGLPGLAPRTVEDLQFDYPEIKTIAAYLGEDTGWALYDTASPGCVNTLARTAPGLGYWLASDETTALSFETRESAEIVHYHADNVGSTNLMTGRDGEALLEALYYPFGALRHEFPGTPKGPDPWYEFGGKERDEESGLHYFEARHYAGPVGRFTQVDPFLVEEPDTRQPQALNPYAYALNAPLKYVDPTGLQSGFAIGLSSSSNLFVSTAEEGGVFVWHDEHGFHAVTYSSKEIGGGATVSTGVALKRHYAADAASFLGESIVLQMGADVGLSAEAGMSIPTSGKQTPVYTEGGGIGIGLPVEASLRYGKTKMESCLFGCDRTTILPKAKSWMGNVVKSVTDQSEGQQVPADDPDVEYGPGGPGPRMEYLEPADTTSSMPQQSEAGGMCSSQSEPMTPYGPQE